MALSQGALRKGDRARAIKEARQAIAIKAGFFDGSADAGASHWKA